MSDLQDWLAMAPGPVARPENLKWDVFLSYRSTNRYWVIQLYDVLTSLGYTVFLDQYVLSPAQRLVSQLDDALATCASGVMIWSSASEDSDWCHKEYASFETRQSADPTFRYVVVKLDGALLPNFAQAKLWLDFSEAREGPRGASLLRLLYGLQDKPLPPQAITLADRVDDETRNAGAAIRAARNNGDAEHLIRLAAGTSIPWTAAPTLLCAAAEALIALKSESEALSVLDRVEAAFPRSLRPRQLRALALARLKRWKEARQILGELYEAGERDPETVGIYARTWMDRYEETGDKVALRKSRDLYAEAFASSPRDFYTGINAASKSVFLGDMDAAMSYAAKVEAIVGTAPKPGNYWLTATVAEVQLIRRNFDAAGKLYETAVTMAPDERASHEATWKQAKLLLEQLKAETPQREAVATAFAHLQQPQAA
jgi:tetratricopeptide (TPR) repeat protein